MSQLSQDAQEFLDDITGPSPGAGYMWEAERARQEILEIEWARERRQRIRESDRRRYDTTEEFVADITNI